MEENAKPERVNTTGKPKECDKVFFDLISFIIHYQSYKRLVMIYGNTHVKPCGHCGDAHRELVQFTFHNQ